MKSVKIIATIGPATVTRDALYSLWKEGMDVVRLNGSHGNIDWHKNAIMLIREIIPDVPILLDLPGRKIRLANFEGEIHLITGDDFTIIASDSYRSTHQIGINHPDLLKYIDVETIIPIDDSSILLKVVNVIDGDILCKVESGGVLRGRKGIHIPSILKHAEFISQRDRELIDLALEMKIDYVGMSFIENSEEVKNLRALLGIQGPLIVSKIETQPAIQNLKEIIKFSDALMIDRGDLSAETNIEGIAFLQKQILKEAHLAALPVIVATEMLNTMIENPIPTKAELSDITNAVIDGASTLMLSGETASGKYPIEAVKMMRRVSEYSSNQLQKSSDINFISTEDVNIPRAIGQAIGLICQKVPITKIIAITKSGYAARMIAAIRPKQPIIAMSNNEATARSMNLLYGTQGIYTDVTFSRTNMNHVPACLEILWKRGEITKDDLILVTAVGYPKSGNRMNMIEMHSVADLIDTFGW